MRLLAAGLLLIGLSSGLGACARYEYTGSLGVRPVTGTLTNPGAALATLPPPSAPPLNVAVYDFQDLTGQNKSSFKVGFPEFSRAITQGASAILVDALKTAGGGSWFNVVERGYLDSLLRERKLIQDTYAFLKKDPKNLIDPLKFAEYIVTGGVVSYDSPIQTANANVLFGNYGGALAHHKDLVTVNLRLVRVRDGVVLTSINVARPILSTAGSADVSRVLGHRILDAQAGVGVQEATQTAVRESIEAGVYELVRQGSEAGLWIRRVVPSPAAVEGPPNVVGRTPRPGTQEVARRAEPHPLPRPVASERAPAVVTTGSTTPIAPPRRNDPKSVASQPAPDNRSTPAPAAPAPATIVTTNPPTGQAATGGNPVPAPALSPAPPAPTPAAAPVLPALPAKPEEVAADFRERAAIGVETASLRGNAETAQPIFARPELPQVALLDQAAH